MKKILLLLIIFCTGNLLMAQNVYEFTTDAARNHIQREVV